MRVPSERLLRIEEIAKQIYLSNSRFSHLFKEQVGVSPGKYSKLVRMRRAAHLLSRTLLSIKEIANLSGFGSESHFFSDFKSLYGLSPSMFRKRAFVSRTETSPAKIAGSGSK